MGWYDILKIERRLQDVAEDFAPEEMQDWRDEKSRIQAERQIVSDKELLEKFDKKWKKLSEWVEQNKDTQDEDLQDTLQLVNYLSNRALKTNDVNIHKKLWNTVKLELRTLPPQWPVHKI